MNTPRLRLFAGPNGSGKSTLNGIIPKELLGVYINPDEIEKEIEKFDFLDMIVLQYMPLLNVTYFKRHIKISNFSILQSFFSYTVFNTPPPPLYNVPKRGSSNE